MVFLQMLSCSQFVPGIAEGEAQEEIWSSVSYLFLISTPLIYRKIQEIRIRQGVLWSEDLKGMLGPEMSRAWGGLAYEGPPAESLFLPKALPNPYL